MWYRDCRYGPWYHDDSVVTGTLPWYRDQWYHNLIVWLDSESVTIMMTSSHDTYASDLMGMRYSSTVMQLWCYHNMHELTIPNERWEAAPCPRHLGDLPPANPAQTRASSSLTRLSAGIRNPAIISTSLLVPARTTISYPGRDRPRGPGQPWRNSTPLIHPATVTLRLRAPAEGDPPIPKAYRKRCV